MLAVNLSPEVRRMLLIEEAREWVGVHEQGGNNRGQVVEIFEAVSHIPPGSPWCMAFVQYCISRIDALGTVLNEAAPRSKLEPSAHCLTVWDKSPQLLRSPMPVKGAVVIWRHGETTDGHAGIVSEVVDGAHFKAIEGNTGPEAGVINRDGDGVFEKLHSITGTPAMSVVGFLLPWEDA